jgi:hypothetical protein
MAGISGTSMGARGETEEDMGGPYLDKNPTVMAGFIPAIHVFGPVDNV